MDFPREETDVHLHNGEFTDGTADGLIEPSRDPASWANAVTREILAVQTAGGLVADEANHTQLRDAIQALIDAALATVGSPGVGDGLELDGAGNLRVKLDGATIARTAAGLKVRRPFIGGTVPITGNARNFVASDDGGVIRRANSGTAMADTLPGTSSGVLTDGWWCIIRNDDAVAAISLSAAVGTTVNGGPTYPIPAGCGAMIHSDGLAYFVELYSTRIQLQGNLSLYVAITGSDANTGLTSASPFATIQAAVTYLQSRHDLNGCTATINVADGYNASGANVIGAFVGAAGPASVVIRGNTATPANCVINSSGRGFSASAGAQFQVQGFKTSCSDSHLYAVDPGSNIQFQNWIFGASATGSHQQTDSYGKIKPLGGYTISGGAFAHWQSTNGGACVSSSVGTITLTGTPAFTYFAYSHVQGCIRCGGNTFSGAAGGARYFSDVQSTIFTLGAGASYLPGNAPGIADSTTYGLYY